LKTGDYSNAAITLENTGLTQFDSGVFQSVLEQMEGSSSFILLLDSNLTFKKYLKDYFEFLFLVAFVFRYFD
jgi:hypothetical protein